MCVVLEPAELSGTLLVAHATHRQGKAVHVLGYQNVAKNLAARPNAMLLPFPAAAPMSRENVVDVSGAPNIMRDMWEAARPRTRTLGHKGNAADLRSVEVFDSGSYTVVLASDARAIPQVLYRVPETKRPAVNPQIFDAYAKWYPKWPVALCCFDGRIKAEPILWWYEPTDPSTFFLPGLDAHDGQVPDLRAEVSTDHKVMFGSEFGSAVTYTDRVPPEVRELLPSRVAGTEVSSLEKNGDWRIPVGGGGREAAVAFRKRVSPPGA